MTTPGTVAQRPLDIQQLADFAYETLLWDPEQPLKRYIGAVRQLSRESKVYLLEGDLDNSFVLSIKIHKLATDLLPNLHPEWGSLPASIKEQIGKGSSAVTLQISELKRLIFQRSEEYERTLKAGPSTSTAPARPATPSKANPVSQLSIAKGSTAALTLKNTVTPGVMSMSSSTSSPGPTEEWLAKYRTKESKTSKLRRKLGVGKRSTATTAPTSSSGLAGELTEPGKDLDADDDAIKEEWTLIDEREAERARANVDFIVPVPAASPTPSTSRQTATRMGQIERDSKGKMPLPGEEVDEAYYVHSSGGINSVQRPWVLSQVPQQAPSVTSNSSSNSNSSSIQLYHPSDPRLVPPSNLPPHPTWGVPTFQQPPMPRPPPLPVQALNQGTVMTQSWPAYPSPLSLPSPSAFDLSRSPSRLTKQHQQQQGFTPSSNLPSAPPPFSTTPSYPMPYPLQHPNAYPSYLTHRSSQSPPTPPALPSLFHDRPSQVPSVSRPRYPTTVSSFAPPAALPVEPSAPPALVLHPVVAPGGSGLVRTSSLAALPVGLSKARRPGSERGQKGPGLRIENLTVENVVEEVEEEELAQTEGGQPLRNLVLPMDLMKEFVRMSKQNTDRGIETCGLLMGTLSHNTFTITHLLVPKQEGTSDTCVTTHEEEQFAFQDERDLMTLGWIHTHPTQSCFMSSLDLHTHASYQVMLAEAIAIVCAPRHQPSFGVFRLTDPPGLETVVKCNLPGAFHPHPDLPIYTDTDHGHVQLRSGIKFECHDLRLEKRR